MKEYGLQSAAIFAGFGINPMRGQAQRIDGYPARYRWSDPALQNRQQGLADAKTKTLSECCSLQKIKKTIHRNMHM